MNRRLSVLILGGVCGDGDAERFLERNGVTITRVAGDGPVSRRILWRDFDAVISHADRIREASVPDAKLSAMQVVAITNHDDPAARTDALRRGAGDVMSAPVDPEELLLRVRRCAMNAKMRLENRDPSTALRFGSWRLDASRCDAEHDDGHFAGLTSGEFELLEVFLNRPQTVLCRDYLLETTRGRHWRPYDRSIDVLVGRLRKKIETDVNHPRMIKTIRGVGYVFTVDVLGAERNAHQGKRGLTPARATGREDRHAYAPVREAVAAGW